MSSFEIIPAKINAVGTTMDDISKELKQISTEIGIVKMTLDLSSGSTDFIKSAMTKIQTSLKNEAEGSKSIGNALREAVRLYDRTDRMLAGMDIEENRSLFDSIRDIVNKVRQWIRKLLDLFGFVTGGSNKDAAYAGDPVNVCTGNYISDIEEIRLHGHPGLAFIRHYNSLYLQDGSMGTGWTHNYEISLEQGEGFLDLTMGNQWRERFLLSAEGVYISRHNKYDFITVGSRESEACPDEAFLSANYTYIQSQGDIYRFETGGKIQSIEVRNGKRICFYYNDEKLEKAVDDVGRQLSYSYGENGLLTAVTDHTGRSISMSYEDGKLAQVISADGRKKAYMYDGAGRLQSITNHAGIVSLWNEYDDENRVVFQRLPDNTTMSYVYAHDAVIVTDRDGSVSTYRHNDCFQITEIIQDGEKKTFFYDDNHQRISVTSPEGAVYQRTYDQDGNTSSLTDPMGHKVEIQYLRRGLPSSIREKDGGISSMEYDENGNLIRYEDALGNVTEYNYENGSITKIIYPDRSEEKFYYDSRNNLLCRQDACGHSIRFAYDEADRPVSRTDGRGNTFLCTYDECDRILTIQNPAGFIREYHYSATGKIDSMTDFDGNEQKWLYNEMDLVVAYINKRGALTSYSYDKNDNLSEVILPNGGKIINTYDSRGRRIRREDELGAVTNYTYDADGRLVCEESDGAVKTYAYDSCGRPVSICEKDGSSSSVEYDAMGRVTRLYKADGSSFQYQFDLLGRCILRTDATGCRREYRYDPCGRLTDIVQDGRKIHSCTYYPDGRLKEEKRALEPGVVNYYDEAGNLSERHFETGYRQFFEYDVLNRRIRISDTEGRSSRYNYDAAGNIISRLDGKGRQKNYRYSPTGQLIEVGDEENEHTIYEYDEMDLLRRIHTGEGAESRTTSFERNKRGQITGILDAEGNLDRYEYDRYGNVILHETPESLRTKYTYDKLGRVTCIQYNDGRSLEMGYDSAGRMTSMKDWSGTMQVDYDPMGRPLYIRDTMGYELRYAYDLSGQRRSVVYPDGKQVNYIADDEGRIVRIITPRGDIRYTYSDSGKIASKSTDHGKTVYEYYNNGLIRNIDYYDQKGKESSIELCYDTCGNIEKKTIWMRENDQVLTLSYEYDSLGRLTAVYENGEPIRAYRYDPFGNRIYTKNQKDEIFSSYNRLNQLTQQRIQKQGVEKEVRWKYNKDGHAVERESDHTIIRLEYDSAGKPALLLQNGEKKALYQYNGLGMRVSQEQEPDKIKSYIYDYAHPHLPAAAVIHDGSFSDYIWNGEITGSLEDKGLCFYQCDHQGSVHRYLSEDGNPLERYSFDEFGTDLYGTAGKMQPFGYTGLLYDDSINGWGTVARTYMPQIGRFLQKDSEKYIHSSIPQSVNLYTYCLNNPILFVDPDGNDCYYFYMPGYEDMARKDQERLAALYGYSIDQVHLVEISTRQELVDGWNQMGTEGGKPVSIDTVVIMTHADPYEMGFEGANSIGISTEDIRNLFHEQSIEDQLILYGCNAGHNDYHGENIGSEFSRKTNGAPVLASDGTVYFDRDTCIYSPGNDESFQYWAGRKGHGGRDRDGWMIYQQVDGETVVTETGMVRATIVDMVNSLLSYKAKQNAE